MPRPKGAKNKPREERAPKAPKLQHSKIAIEQDMKNVQLLPKQKKWSEEQITKLIQKRKTCIQKYRAKMNTRKEKQTRKKREHVT
jgi:hypothetical protein